MMNPTNVNLNFIDGKWCNTSSKAENLSSINPANKEIIGYYQNSSEQDVDQAVEAAKNAKNGWRKMSGAAKGNILYKAAEILESRQDEIAERLTKEMGKPIAEAKGETSRGVAILRYYAGEGMRKIGDVIPASDSKALMYTDRVPLGIVGIIAPWNFPVAIPLWKIAPAIIYGNTVVFKPAQDAAITAAKVIECLEEARLPKGIVKYVTEKRSVVGERIITHPDVKGISFTGSNKTGQRVAEGAVARGAKYQLEMGGKNPLIIADDADLDEAVKATISGGYGSTGQKCTATSRVIVHEKIYDEFKQKLVDKVQSMKVGDGLYIDTDLPPSVNEQQLNTVLYYIDKAKEEGASLLTGGKKPKDSNLQSGYFIEPTIFENVKSNMTLGQEEVFGPVLALMKVSSVEEGINIANDIEFGLSASIFTKNTDNVFNFIDKIEAGLVRVNFETAGVELHAPCGGMKGSSSDSREQGEAAKEFFTSIRTVFIKP